MKKVDSTVIALISKMLEKDPTKRISATECLQDSFFLRNIISTMPDLKN